ncbi:DUF1284 domain-containing protein [Heliorestis convoluta]|uniref:DUF1284 domain-containing protein n=1 Tax=Heliorestis convoluta TaxID=356322 RepID=A0A5Q2MXW6_9FIRM|nr:DUF1284 domain-containing protein [Heliorestis convoluta]QGG46203.1 hypothetical protein FTV88_0024 [Heliorestis convoluta]
MLKLRGHHLVCLHFFRGEGYNQEFIDNLFNVMGRAERGEEIEVIAEADDICKACPSRKGAICASKEGAESEIQALDAQALALLKMKKGDKTTWMQVKEPIQEATEEWFQSFCTDCGWSKVCNK